MTSADSALLPFSPSPSPPPLQLRVVENSKFNHVVDLNREVRAFCCKQTLAAILQSLPQASMSGIALTHQGTLCWAAKSSKLLHLRWKFRTASEKLSDRGVNPEKRATYTQLQ